MWEPLTAAVLVLAGLVGLVVAAYTALDRRLDGLVLGGVTLLEAGLVVQLAVGVGAVVRGAPDGVSVPTFLGYLVGVLVVPPLGVLWALGERSRAGTAVLLVAALVVAVLVLRLGQIWGGGG